MKKIKDKKSASRVRRHKKIRSKIANQAGALRLSVFKSNKYIYAQIIDDTLGKTLVSASSLDVKGKNAIERAKETGKDIAKKAIAKKIDKVVFDRGGFVYTGRIKAVAEGAREGGLKF